MWKGHLILWEHFERVYHFNNQTDLHLYRCLSRDHIYPKLHEKMQNHLAENVLNANMLNLIKAYQKTLHKPSKLNGVIALLEHTFVFVQIFSSVTSKIQSMYDYRLHQLKEVLTFFHHWESEYSDPKLCTKHLTTRETCEDIDSYIYDFMHLAKVGYDSNVPVTPRYINSDLIENWFGQIRSLCNVANHNPTLKQIGPSINSNIITGSVISKKGNAGGIGYKYKGIRPPTKKFKQELNVSL